MTYNYAIYRNNLLLTRTITILKANRLAKQYNGIVKRETYVG